MIDGDRMRSLSGSEAGLGGYWRFNEASGQTVTDSAVNANHGTLGGTSAAAGDDPARSTEAAPIAPD